MLLQYHLHCSSICPVHPAFLVTCYRQVLARNLRPNRLDLILQENGMRGVRDIEDDLCHIQVKKPWPTDSFSRYKTRVIPNK